MLLTEFDEKKYYKTVKEEGREEGREEERTELIRTMYQNGFDIDTIAKGTNISPEKIREIVDSL